ncbi:hypothetical protein [Kitasatospora purpeofusca]|uniref:hypothetical protein n=1 Tax=Kitasatospora purpeofusca TaxID=67352 RepID=UPI0038292173
MSRTLAGRRQAEHIAHCTVPVADAWITDTTELPAAEVESELRFAAEVAALTGTDPMMWLAGESDGTQTRRRLVAQGAAAIVRTDRSVEPITPTVPGCDFAEMEAEIAFEAAYDKAQAAADKAQAKVTAAATRRTKAREHALKHYTEDQLAAFGDDPMEAWGKDVREQVETWSPFSATRRADARYIVRCADGTRRYGDGSLADPH